MSWRSSLAIHMAGSRGRTGSARKPTRSLHMTREIFARPCALANRSPSHIEPVSGMPKRKLENGEQRLARKATSSDPKVRNLPTRDSSAPA